MVKLFLKMSNSFFDSCKEVIILSEIIRKQEFKACFFQHFKKKVEDLNQSRSSNLDVTILQRLQSKLLEPLKFHLKALKKSSDKCLLIECLVQVVKLTLVDDVDEFFDLYTLVFFQIFENGNSNGQISEELKMSVLEFCTLLLKYSTSAVLEKIYDEKFGAKFSLGISISINLVKEERSISLRLASLEFLLSASKFQETASYNVGLYKKIGDLFALYLPGIIAPLLEVIMRNETQHHLITVKALTCWGHVLCLVMSDFDRPQILSESEILREWQVMLKNPGDKIVDIHKSLKGNRRTKSWLEAAAVAIKPLIIKISEVRKHSHLKCRLELTQVMSKLLKNCKTNLQNCLTSVIEVLVSSAYDEEKNICEVANKALYDLENECKKTNIKIFVTIMEENLQSLLIKLPQIIRLENEKLVLASLKSLSGYLKILGKLNQIHHILNLSSMFRKIVLVIQIGFELEVYPEISNQDFFIVDNERQSNGGWWLPWKKFKHFTDPSITIQLEEICQILGRFSPPDVLFDFLLDAYNIEGRFKNELILIINATISGIKEMLDHIVRQLLDFYLDQKNLYPELQVDEFDCRGPRDCRNNIIKVALVMEGFGKLAKNLGTRFENYLMSTLFYLLERMGSPYAIIRESATASAVEIAKACGFEGKIGALIAGNVDYLTYQLTIKLKKNDASVFDVASVLFNNSNLQTLPHLEEIINAVLKSSSKNVDSPHTNRYLRLMQNFVRCVNKWIKSSRNEFLTANKESENKSEMEKLIQYLKTSQKGCKEVETEDEEETNAEAVEEGFPDEKNAFLPKYINLTVLVANHCLHYLPSKDRDKKLLVLDTLNESILILADRENELLPLVHKIWSPLVARFDQITDPLIINRSFALLCTLSHTSGYFIRSRTLKNVLPTLQSFLIKESQKSKLKVSSSGYFFTQNFKLQRQLLDNLGMLASSLKLFERQTDLIAESALLYLSTFQPKELQDKSKKLFKDLNAYDPYLVRLKLQNIRNDPEFEPNVSYLLNFN